VSEDATTWGEMREKIVDAFAGQAPYDENDEHKIVEAWQRNPRRIEVEVERLAQRQTVGQVTFPWRVLAKIAPTIIGPVDATATANVDAEKARAQRRFLSWIRNAGLHCDRWEDVYDEAFGERGRLQLWKDEGDVIDEVRACWEEHRPRGVEVERRAEERMLRYRKQGEPVPPEPR
jgi:hypothetical protein